MSYEKVGWKDYPDKTTPTNAKNLDHMDEQIKKNADNIGDVEKIADIGDGTVAGAIAENAEKNTELYRNIETIESAFVYSNCGKTHSVINTEYTCDVPSGISLNDWNIVAIRVIGSDGRIYFNPSGVVISLNTTDFTKFIVKATDNNFLNKNFGVCFQKVSF